jgi:glucosamine-6-phosphate deaminase
MNYYVFENFPALGKNVALSFLKWVHENPEGVISLPTGKTPEYFIKWVGYLLENRGSATVRKELEEVGVPSGATLDMRGLRFVQMDEFYPIDPRQHNSFCYYVRHFYIKGFGLDANKALVMDCSRIGLKKGLTINEVWPDMKVDLTLRHRAPESRLEEIQKATIHRIDQWCQNYEDRIRRMGGIGFFLGGIGPDGHVAFNIRGSDHHSTTRLTSINYETQAAAAGDLGGMEVAKDRLVITAGLSTITSNPACKAILMAAGEAKAGVVADAVEKPTGVLYPATALRKLPGAGVYLTAGAANRIMEHRLRSFRSNQQDRESMRRVLIDTATSANKRILDLNKGDLSRNAMGEELLRMAGSELSELAQETHDHLAGAIERGMESLTDTTFLHTEPHHDDVMLGYLPAAVRNIRQPTNRHFFMTLTSGFTSVTNFYMEKRLRELAGRLESQDFKELEREDYFDPAYTQNRNRDVWQYLDGVASRDQEMCSEGAARRLLRDLKEVYETDSVMRIREEIRSLLQYLADAYPGKKDISVMQKLKGMCREWEAECLWGYFGWQCSNVLHMRLGFYSGDIFTAQPDRERDVAPVVREMKRVRPDVVSVALDPEGSGPDTHYKVMQAIHAALNEYQQEEESIPVRIWGYRNIWYRFHPAEMNMCVPVSLNMLSIMHSAFMNTFVSQRDASFPSYEYDGPFSRLAQKIQVEQYRILKTCLGREWFHDHSNAMIRATRGLVFIKEMDVKEFYRHSRDLRHAAEDTE